jgi:S1-C subfamily serine protease
VQGLGTGFFISSSGYILTNYHVAGTATTIAAILEDGTRLEAERIWGDRALDLAVVRCKTGGPFQPVTLGSVEDLVVGDAVITIGTPLDMAFQHTVTAGIVSGKNRTLQVPTEEGLSFLEELIQTDASINPGNSGGPLVALDGKVVGINTVKVQEAEGLGFAIPADLAQPIVKSIIATGNFVAPYVGMTVIDSDIARYYGMQVKEGLLVLNVDTEGPAYKAGLRKDDTVISVEDTKVSSVLAFRRRIYEAQVGQTVTIHWLREGNPMQGDCVLIQKPVS